MKLRARFTAIGEDIDNLAVGDQVICPGGCVEEINISSRAVTKVPAAVDLNVAASFRNNYATAYYGLQRGMLKAGETLLVHGAAGGVGLASVDLGKLFGARVIATASADAKLDVVQSMGAETIGGIRPPHNARSPTLARRDASCFGCSGEGARVPAPAPWSEAGALLRAGIHVAR